MKDRCILCDGAGSGKSRTGLTCYYLHGGDQLGADDYIPMEKPRDPCVITTAHRRGICEWQDDLALFLLPPNPDASHYKSKAVTDSQNNIIKYVDAENAFFTFDEQQAVGHDAQTKTPLKVVKPDNQILLPATPGDTRQDYVPVFIINGFYHNKTDFVGQHMIYDWQAGYPKINGYRNTGRLIQLRDKILVNINFKQQTVPHHEDVQTSHDISRYKDIVRSRWNLWEDWPAEMAAELCMAPRRVTNSDESRAIAVLELLENHLRAAIFYSYDYEPDILCSLGYPGGMEIVEWNGYKHQKIPTGDKRVYLVRHTVGCEGWNCITTDTIISYSQQYSYKAATQAVGRIGWPTTLYRDLNYYHLKSFSGIDLTISKAPSKKRNLSEGGFIGWATKPLKVNHNVEPEKYRRAA